MDNQNLVSGSTPPGPRVSVLLPCFNGAGTIEQALASLQQQSINDFEILAVDDGSSDETPDLLRSWAERDQRLKILTQPHTGLIPALNAGLAASSAPFVARMDADDCADPERLGRQLARLEADPGLAVVGCLVRGFPADQVREGFQIYIAWLNDLVTDEQIRREIFVESPLVHPSVMFRKDWIVRVGGYQDHGWAEDYDLWLRLYLAGARFEKVPEILLDWREHPDRLTRTDSRYSLENFLRAKAHYAAKGPLADRDGVFVWGAGMMGRRLSKHLIREGVPLVAFIDIDPRKIGRTRRGRPILAPEDLPAWWSRYHTPGLFAAVGARGARPLIRERLVEMGLQEGADWWSAA